MKIKDGAVIVWCIDEAKIFNSVLCADKYFNKKAKQKKDPEWQRVFEPKRILNFNKGEK